MPCLKLKRPFGLFGASQKASDGWRQYGLMGQTLLLKNLTFFGHFLCDEFSEIVSLPVRYSLFDNPGETVSPEYDTLGRFKNNFNTLVSGPGRFELWKNTGGRKSRWNVPLRYPGQWQPSEALSESSQLMVSVSTTWNQKRKRISEYYG